MIPSTTGPAIALRDLAKSYRAVHAVRGVTFDVVGDLLPLLAPLPVRDLEIIEPALEDVLRSFYREVQP